MAIQINGNTVIADDKRGDFNLLNAGAYTQQQLTDLVIRGVEVGDAVYNTDREALSYWDGEKWIPVDNACGEAVYTTSGTFSWIAPRNVTSVCVVCVGGGGAGGSKNYKVGGGGGGLGWRNNIPVTPGESYTVVVGKGGVHGTSSGNGGDSYFLSPETVLGGGGLGGNNGYENGGRFVGQGGGRGGQTAGANIVAHGGAGAGGYTGPGGDAHNNSAGSPGQGGGGGAGQDSGVSWGMRGNGGGGVGIYGQGADGKGGGNVVWLPNDDPNGKWRNYCGPNPGEGGSVAHNTGTDGTKGSTQTNRPWSGGNGNGGFPGGGGGQQEGGKSNNNNAEGTPGRGGGGAVRIIWGKGRAFPNTRAGKDECGDGEVFVPPILNSAGSIPSSSTDGETISVTGASKTDGTLASNLEYNWHRVLRSDNSVSSLGWGAANSTIVNDTYSRYWSEVRAKDTEGNVTVIKETNNCTIELPAPPPDPSPSPSPGKYDCGQGTWSGPQHPGVWSGTKVATLSAGSVFEVGGGYYNNNHVQYAAFFTKNGSTLQVRGNGRWINEGSELVTWQRGGRCSVKLTADDEVHGVAVTIRHTQTDSTGFANTLISSTGRGNGSKTTFLGTACQGNSSVVAVHAGCVFDRSGHYVWGQPSGGGWGAYGDNYIKLFTKFFDVNGTPGTSAYFYSEETSKVVAVAGKNVGQPRI